MIFKFSNFSFTVQRINPLMSSSSSLKVPEEILGVKKNRSDEEIIDGIERSYALDTAALIGGNEYLVYEIIDKLTQCIYNDEECNALRWALSKLWTVSEGTSDFLKTVDLHQGHLIDFFSQSTKSSLPRILALSLLYCGRYDDTTVIQNTDDPNHKIIIMNMVHHNVELPVGETINKTPCNQIALLYFSPPEDHVVPPPQDSPPRTRRNQARRISESLALEKEMLSIINVFAIFPVP